MQRGQHEEQPGPGDRLAAEVAHVGVERLGAGDREHDRGQREEGDVEVPDHECQRVRRRERLEDLRMVDDAARLRMRRSPRTRRSSPARTPVRRRRCRRRWTANSATMITAVIGTIHSSRSGSTTLRPSTADSTEIAGVIMLSPKNSDAPKMPSAASTTRCAAPAPTPPPQQGDERHDAALAVVVGAHHERDVGERDDDHDRPEDQRHDAVDVVRVDRYGVRIAGVEHRLNGVDRAGSDVAEHDPECTDNKGQPRRFRNTLCARRPTDSEIVCIVSSLLS